LGNSDLYSEVGRLAIPKAELPIAKIVIRQIANNIPKTLFIMMKLSGNVWVG
tara:strand:+ start:532 stop:687 length:156 start_codon:yes stop_codon:yes gene_type:complete